MDKKKVADYIVDWLNNYVDTIPVKGFIVGVSGGVDSALVAALCARTNRPVILLNLPIRQSAEEYNRAEIQIHALESRFSNVKGLKVDLTQPFDSFIDAMPVETQNDQLSLANVRARLRMTTLYAVGQTNQSLVVGTGNKVEDFGIGFFTKYGDGGVDINPIADLMKSEVYQLAEYLEVIPEIIQAKPTDGLWGDDRNDEDQIGASYDELEWAMQYHGGEDELNSRQKEVWKIYKHRNKINQHKFHPIPFCDLSKVK